MACLAESIQCICLLFGAAALARSTGSATFSLSIITPWTASRIDAGRVCHSTVHYGLAEDKKPTAVDFFFSIRQAARVHGQPTVSLVGEVASLDSLRFVPLRPSAETQLVNFSWRIGVRLLLTRACVTFR